MRILTRIAAAACLSLLVATATTDARETPSEASAWLRARIALDANGTLESIQWLDAKPGDRPITARLEEVVRGWEFEPGTVDGVPVATETGLTLHVTAKPNAQGGIALGIGSASTGAMSQPLTPPRYPVDAARVGAEALLKLQVDINAAGMVVSAKVTDYESNSKSKYSRQALEKAALEAATAWSFHPEKVGGKSLPVSMRMRISFCMSSWCVRKEAEIAASSTLEAEAPTGMAVALDSAVKIKTRTTQAEI